MWIGYTSNYHPPAQDAPQVLKLEHERRTASAVVAGVGCEDRAAHGREPRACARPSMLRPRRALVRRARRQHRIPGTEERRAQKECRAQQECCAQQERRA